jgi:hypothetical protein
MTRGLMCSISAARSDSAAASSFIASFAVLLFEPHTTETGAAKSPRSERITPTNIAAKTSPPPATAIREARMNLRQLPILAASSDEVTADREAEGEEQRSSPHSRATKDGRPEAL